MTTIVGILLAGGRGRRFDPSGQRNKLLQAATGCTSIAEASARAMLTVFPHVVAVVPEDDGGVAQVLRGAGCDVTVCAGAGLGMGASLAHAVHYAREAAGWVIGLADMPFVHPATLVALRRALEQGAGIAAPFHAGRRGNPVGFGRAYLQHLLALEGDQGARSLLTMHAVTPIAVDDPGIFRDIDTPSDLHKNGTLPLSGQAETS